MENGGPQVKAAAKVALSGPPYYLQAFLQLIQYKAQRLDDESLTHIARVSSLVADAARQAALARARAAEAAQAAAIASQAAAEAGEYAQQARAYSDQAAVYADQALQFAEQAQTYADNAAQSAETASTAAKTADEAALAGENSADEAKKSADDAEKSADIASFWANEAQKSIKAANEDANKALIAKEETLKIAAEKKNIEDANRIAIKKQTLAPDDGCQIVLAGWVEPSYETRIVPVGWEGTLEEQNARKEVRAQLDRIMEEYVYQDWPDNGYNAYKNESLEAYYKKWYGDAKANSQALQGYFDIMNLASYWGPAAYKLAKYDASGALDSFLQYFNPDPRTIANIPGATGMTEFFAKKEKKAQVEYEFVKGSIWKYVIVDSSMRNDFLGELEEVRNTYLDSENDSEEYRRTFVDYLNEVGASNLDFDKSIQRLEETLPLLW